MAVWSKYHTNFSPIAIYLARYFSGFQIIFYQACQNAPTKDELYRNNSVQNWDCCSRGGPGEAPAGAGPKSLAGAKAPPGAGPEKLAGAKAPPGAGPENLAGAKAPPGAGPEN